MPFRKVLVFAGLLAATALDSPAQNPTYRFITNLGNIDVVLTPNAAPKTVANFLSYLNAGYYSNTVFHRSVPGFVVQGGGYQYLPAQTPSIVAIPQSPAIPNEFNVTNATGTIAMALVSGNPNSATSEWFFNLANNGTNAQGLDSQLFTVFGQTNAAGITVLNKIAAVPVSDYSSTLGSDFSTLPVSNGNFVVVSSIVPIPAATTSGFASAASYAPSSANGISPGEILTIFGTGLGPSQVALGTIDANGVLSKSAGGTQVTFNGTPAPVLYSSATQVSVVVPYGVASLPVVSVVISYNQIATGSLSFNVKPANPAIFTLNTSGSGDGVIVKYQGNDYSVISAANPASAGDVLTLFGEGYGAPTPSTSLADGTIVTTTLPVPAGATPQLLIDGNPVATSYFGGAPYLVNGVLQVNFAVPSLAPGAHQIQLSIAGRTSPSGVTVQTK